jgi:uncharacterized phage protein (TIGR02218 family)
MTSYPPALLAHLSGEITSVCHCWKLTRTDGTVLGFTDHDEALAVDGQPYAPSSGFTGSEARDTLGLAAGSIDVEGALSSDLLREEDVAAGLYDGARVETLLVNWRSPADFALIRTATIGRITLSDNRFVAELQGAFHALDQASGRYVRRQCDAELGDGRCGVALAGGFHGTGAVVAAAGIDTIEVSGIDGFADDWFSGGVLSWTSGANAGRTARVLTHSRLGSDVTLVLWPGTGFAPVAGDAFAVTAGCDKSFAACKAKFGNAENFRGFPHLPGNDAGYGYVTDGGVFDGGPVVP